jgi:hypothetical protein
MFLVDDYKILANCDKVARTKVDFVIENKEQKKHLSIVDHPRIQGYNSDWKASPTQTSQILRLSVN